MIALWLGGGLFYAANNFWITFKSYGGFDQLTLPEKNTLINPKDFYHFLLFCDECIPKNSTIQWILPNGSFLGNDEFYFFRAYYYLYPRNYHQNAEYVIVFKNPDYIPSLGYEIFSSYAKDMYILLRKLSEI